MNCTRRNQILRFAQDDKWGGSQDDKWGGSQDDKLAVER